MPYTINDRIVAVLSHDERGTALGLVKKIDEAMAVIRTIEFVDPISFDDLVDTMKIDQKKGTFVSSKELAVAAFKRWAEHVVYIMENDS